MIPRVRSKAGPYAVAREIEDMEALLKDAGGSAFVYGISSGAALALEAVNRLTGIRKLALYEAPFSVDDAMQARWRTCSRMQSCARSKDRRTW